ncbi:NifU family protein [Alkalilimnicola ehrlichii MLHE-1]|uniref:Fe/S biogenesis protein NfuA n=1 Tax=Alkalilimnicola ehrlichii (strain ATCC BAA-1101 / DSM 17681 / MLHE-1) TaxID=187272 RepID=Q0A5U0_ALKEH|nr:NifU family protein [Alkalilimnicola ehrlichii]ABI57797.1 HesB/YadR/YfhF-family protein [Alkalilimnicola ehrlichii MLHE-1]
MRPTIQISPEAQAHFRQLLSDPARSGASLRIYVLNPGSREAHCGIGYRSADTPGGDEATLAFEGFELHYRPTQAFYLEGVVVDYRDAGRGGRLTMKAPNAARLPEPDAMQSLEERITHVLETEINPDLAAHDGSVTVERVDEQGRALIRFAGGCQGCAVVDQTLTGLVEKTLLARVPALTGIRDVTNHAAGTNPFHAIRSNLEQGAEAAPR